MKISPPGLPPPSRPSLFSLLIMLSTLETTMRRHAALPPTLGKQSRSRAPTRASQCHSSAIRRFVAAMWRTSRAASRLRFNREVIGNSFEASSFLRLFVSSLVIRNQQLVAQSRKRCEIVAVRDAVSDFRLRILDTDTSLIEISSSCRQPIDRCCRRLSSLNARTKISGLTRLAQ